MTTRDETGEDISWERFAALVQQLAQQIRTFEPQIIDGIARDGGLFRRRYLVHSRTVSRALDTRQQRLLCAKNRRGTVRPPDKVRNRADLVDESLPTVIGRTVRWRQKKCGGSAHRSTHNVLCHTQMIHGPIM